MNNGGLEKALGGQEMPVLLSHYNAAIAKMENERHGYSVELMKLPGNKFKMKTTRKENVVKAGWSMMVQSWKKSLGDKVKKVWA